MTPLTRFGDQPIILDGALATELEARGADLSGGLWSARTLRDEPQLIHRVHHEYLRAGADCLISSSYQATIEGYVAHGSTETEAIALIRRSVTVAREARDAFWARVENRLGRRRPLVAASVGPYGASRADGSEYTGDYDRDENALFEFHRRRWEILAGSGADLLACETIPSRAESRALLRLLDLSPGTRAWFSYCCRDGSHIADGTPLAEALAPLASHPQVVALGINCTPPHHVSSLIREARAATDLPIVVYPNSGESWDSASGTWSTGVPEPAIQDLCREWHALGAQLIGGCCRTRPEDIRAVRQQLAGRTNVSPNR